MIKATKWIHGKGESFLTFANSQTGRGIFKCALAYFLGSLVTFVPALAGLIGSQQDSKHMVATVTVWFHPARTIGSMHLATALGLLGFLYSGVIGFTSMGISLAARHQDMLVVGHVVILILFVGGGLGAIAWVKQKFSDPLVNTATALASLGCIIVLVREGSVQEGEFSYRQVVQVLEMLLMGIVVTTAINVLVLPVTARTELKVDMENNTDLLGELLISITRAFLSGREEDLQDEFFEDLQKEHQSALQKMNQDLREAKNEYFVLGNEKLYDVASRLVDCLDRLSQDLGGLRSAALAQFALVNSSSHHNTQQHNPSETPEGRRPSWFTSAKERMPGLLDVINEASNENEDTDEAAVAQPGAVDSYFAPLDRSVSATSVAQLESPEDMFRTFIKQLGPPTKSLVYTLKQILDELPFNEPQKPQTAYTRWLNSNFEVAINDNFHSSLKDAIALYRTSRKEALDHLYASRAVTAAYMPPGVRKAAGAFSAGRTKTGDSLLPETNQAGKSTLDRPPEEVLADIEEVSACCGHFSFSLMDLAEDVMTYLNLLEELKTSLEHPRLSWRWLMFWRLSWTNERPKFQPGHDFERGVEHGRDHDIPEPIRKADEFADPEKAPPHQPWTRWLYRRLHIFRRDDIKFAIKVGVGAILYSLPAFIISTRPFFTYWRGEWGLVSYMAVCCMTIGAANTTGINRFIGTFIGAFLAIVAWVLSANNGDANPYLLAFFGFLVACGCHYLIVGRGQGPMGRFILLTYNLGALYAYSLSVGDEDHDEDEGGIDPAIWDIVLHRLVAVVVGSIWAIVITRFVWPISARRKLRDGLCVLWLRMSLVWKRDPLAMFLLGEPRSSYMDIREEAELHAFLSYLDTLRSAAQSEFELRGPFPNKIIGRIIERTRRMLDAFHAMNVVITKDLGCTPGEAAVLRYTRDQRYALSARISHLFSVLASSYKLEYPLNDALPSIENSRDRLLARISEFRRTGEGRDVTTEQDYELLYAYVLVTGQLAQDIQAVSSEIETLFGTLNEENLKLQ